jgi:hypothetical protein
MTVVLETTDHVKRTYRREKIPIQIYHASETKLVTSLRYCTADFGVPDVGIISVLSIDANEIDPKGETIARHIFR